MSAAIHFVIFLLIALFVSIAVALLCWAAARFWHRRNARAVTMPAQTLAQPSNDHSTDESATTQPNLQMEYYNTTTVSQQGPPRLPILQMEYYNTTANPHRNAPGGANLQTEYYNTPATSERNGSVILTNRNTTAVEYYSV
jgi:cytoskeletal protein RodZ